MATTELTIDDVNEVFFTLTVIDPDASTPAPPPSNTRLVIKQGDTILQYPGSLRGGKASFVIDKLDSHFVTGAAEVTLEVEISERVFRKNKFNINMVTGVAVEAEFVEKTLNVVEAPVQQPQGLSENPTIARAQTLNNLKKLRGHYRSTSARASR